ALNPSFVGSNPAAPAKYFVRREMNKHILFVSGHCCIRVRKQALALKEKGYIVDSISLERPSETYMFNSFKVRPRLENLWEEIKKNPAELIHVHNEPDSLMYQADKGANGRPIVYDCHDLEYHRFGEVREAELFAFYRADAIVQTSIPYRNLAFELHPWEVPDIIIYSAPLRSQIPIVETRERRGIVYQGGLAIPGHKNFLWRDMSRMKDIFHAAELPFHIYGGTFYKQYYMPAYKGHLPYSKLMETLHNYQYGFLGSEPYDPKWDVAIPNKLWEYAATGVIPLILNAKASAEIFPETAGSIVAFSPKELVEKIRNSNPEELREKLLPRYMEDEIVKLINLYSHLL
ncbi:MAG: hypothetical protein RBR68_15615, partial [Tenuifilaceae bacterium]|nr:hypothetical protein [Tenuifilaceae bacterium]